MAGSLNHIVYEQGYFKMSSIENLGDAAEALHECHQWIAELLYWIVVDDLQRTPEEVLHQIQIGRRFLTMPKSAPQLDERSLGEILDEERERG